MTDSSLEVSPLPRSLVRESSNSGLSSAGILVAYFLSAELAKAPFFRRFEV